MDVEETIELILKMQVKTQERFDQWEDRFVRSEEWWEQRFAKVEARMDRADRRMDRLEGVVKQLVRSGLSLRGDARQLQQFRVRTEENLAEITGKLDALIDVVDKWIRRNGGAG